MWYFIGGIVIAFLLYFVFMYFYSRKIMKTLTQPEFIAGYRKAQLIDIRENNVFKAGHILGARNIPMTQLKTRSGEIRNDLPIYLYDQSGFNTLRAVQILRKKGAKDIYVLDGGFKSWTGKIKHK